LVTDVDGNTFLDLTAAFGVAAVGHTNERVAKAIAEQGNRLIHGMGDVHPPAIKVELARKIAEHAPRRSGRLRLRSERGRRC
jgi:4-aminobutyrate aminotransferase-like enzyme